MSNLPTGANTPSSFLLPLSQFRCHLPILPHACVTQLSYAKIHGSVSQPICLCPTFLGSPSCLSSLPGKCFMAEGAEMTNWIETIIFPITDSKPGQTCAYPCVGLCAGVPSVCPCVHPSTPPTATAGFGRYTVGHKSLGVSA